MKYGQQRVETSADVPVSVTDGATPVAFPAPTGPVAAFAVEPPFLASGDQATFTADEIPHARYTWLFGDGTIARGRRVTHKFSDALGTALDDVNGAGRFASSSTSKPATKSRTGPLRASSSSPSGTTQILPLDPTPRASPGISIPAPGLNSPTSTKKPLSLRAIPRTSSPRPTASPATRSLGTAPSTSPSMAAIPPSPRP